MKKILFLISVCSLLSSCDKYTNYDLPKDKIPLLQNNDIVYFQDSASSKIDTFRLDVRNYRQITGENGSLEHIDIYYNFLNRKVFLIYRVSTTWMYGGYNNIYNILFENESRRLVLYELINSTINGKTYPSVKLLYVNIDTLPDTIPNKVYYTFANGIIRYEYKDGRVYNLLSK
ncbi:MAG: hypothetical protein WCG08_05855 [Paludibacter sp.]